MPSLLSSLFTGVSGLASNSSGNFVPVKTFAAGLATDVVFEDGKAFAIVNGQKLAVNEVSKVSL